jgi:hypothetical protein
MQVEADVFSGRPNPRWPLDSAQAAELTRRLGELPTAPARAASDGLGYRGLVVTGLTGECAELRVHGGQVHAQCAGATRAYTDAGRAFERWLLATGGSALEPATTEMLRKEVGA